MIDKYGDIINLPHHISKKHPQMSMQARAAQFAPFAALTGYEDEVKETARLTDERIEIDEEMKNDLDFKLQLLEEEISTNPEITITYFIPDEKKQGGKYVKITGSVKSIDSYNQNIVLTNNKKIPINEIIEISEID